MSFGARLRSSGRDESRRGGEQWPARWTAATLLDLAPREPEDGDGRGGRDGAGSFEVPAWLRAALNAEVGHDYRCMDALAGDHSGGMGVGAQYRAQERHCLLV